MAEGTGLRSSDFPVLQVSGWTPVNPTWILQEDSKTTSTQVEIEQMSKKRKRSDANLTMMDMSPASTNTPLLDNIEIHPMQQQTEQVANVRAKKKPWKGKQAQSGPGKIHKTRQTAKASTRERDVLSTMSISDTKGIDMPTVAELSGLLIEGPAVVDANNPTFVYPDCGMSEAQAWLMGSSSMPDPAVEIELDSLVHSCDNTVHQRQTHMPHGDSKLGSDVSVMLISPTATNNAEPGSFPTVSCIHDVEDYDEFVGDLFEDMQHDYSNPFAYHEAHQDTVGMLNHVIGESEISPDVYNEGMDLAPAFDAGDHKIMNDSSSDLNASMFAEELDNTLTSDSESSHSPKFQQQDSFPSCSRVASITSEVNAASVSNVLTPRSANCGTPPRTKFMDLITVHDAIASSRPAQLRSQSPAAPESCTEDDYQPMLPFARPDFPSTIRDRCPVVGFSSKLLLRTCFRIGEAIKIRSQIRTRTEEDGVLIELYARVTTSCRETGTAKQHFQLCDLFHDRPPLLSGVLENYKTSSVQDDDGWDLLGKNEPPVMVRCMGRFRRDMKTAAWQLCVLNIRETDWEEVRRTSSIVAQGVVSPQHNIRQQVSICDIMAGSEGMMESLAYRSI